MRLEFVELACDHPVFAEMKEHGAKDHRRWVARTEDENWLRALYAYEPHDNGLWLHHISISVSRTNTKGAVYGREPTDDECRQVTELFPKHWEENNVGAGPGFRNFYAE